MTAVTLFDDAVVALRATRRKRRTAELEWFEVAYRVYLVALFGGGLVAWLSSLVRDEQLAAGELADVHRYGPAVGGTVAAVAVLLGLRSGARGGPLALEEAEVRHVLLAPVSRACALRRPAWQRIRTLLATGAVVGAVAGQLAGRRLTAPLPEWAMYGALAGATVAAMFVGVAFAAHAIRWRDWQATAVGLALVAAQLGSVTGVLPAGPFDTVGSLALWPLGVEPVDLIAPTLALALLIVGFAVLERLSVEQISRRTSLVAQLRFAVTMQDVRTVMLLRRQLSLEQTRERPWVRIPTYGPASWRRSAQSIARFPGRRIGRVALLAAIAGAADVVAFRGTSPLFLVAGAAWFLVGLDLLEPLAQELDHPDLTDAFPHEPGKLHQRLLLAPALATVGVSTVAIATAFALEPSPTTLAVGVLFGIPSALVGLAGATLNAIGGAPDPFATGRESNFLPPEIAGLHLALRAVWPFAVAVAGSATILLVREAVEQGHAATGAALRAGIGQLVIVAFVAYWVERRLAFRRWWANLLAQGRANAPGARSTGAN